MKSYAQILKDADVDQPHKAAASLVVHQRREEIDALLAAIKDHMRIPFNTISWADADSASHTVAMLEEVANFLHIKHS